MSPKLMNAWIWSSKPALGFDNALKRFPSRKIARSANDPLRSLDIWREKLRGTPIKKSAMLLDLCGVVCGIICRLRFQSGDFKFEKDFEISEDIALSGQTGR